jgi:hypothetical protein
VLGRKKLNPITRHVASLHFLGVLKVVDGYDMKNLAFQLTLGYKFAF